MAAVAPTDGRDELDRILDYDDAVEDFLKDVPISNDTQGDSGTAAPRVNRDEDEEVQVKRKRNPVPKLDENRYAQDQPESQEKILIWALRLLSDAGITKLRKVAKTRLKFKGKGHEFSDMSRLLNTYQLWLDDLYPRAKFRDGLAMIEKVGHSKRMQVMRKAWLDETKAFNRDPTPDPAQHGAGSGNAASHSHNEASRDEDLFADMMQEENQQRTATSGGNVDAPDDDDLDALLAENDRRDLTPKTASKAKPAGSFTADDGPDDDELDALLAEHEEQRPAQKQKPRGPFMNADSDDDDELDALMAEQESITQAVAPSKNVAPNHQQQPSEGMEDDFTAEEEAMAGMDDIS